MTEKLLTLLPPGASASALPYWLLPTAAVAGLFLYIFGARFSRAIYTTAFVIAGLAIGPRLPELFPQQLAGSDTRFAAAAAAIVAGVLGLTFHRFWSAVSLAVLLTAWSALANWVLFAPGSSDPFAWPALPKPPFTAEPIIAYGKDLWLAVPSEVQQHLPLICGTAYAFGLALTLVLPRYGVALLHTLLGTTLLTASALVYTRSNHPDALTHLPSQPWSQPAILATVLLISFALQLRFTAPRLAGPATPPPLPPAED